MAETTQITNENTTETVNAAENTVDNGGTSVGGDPKSTTEKPEQSAKTFSQAELDDIVKQRLERAAKGQPSKEELKAFKAWQDSQKTAEQLSAEKISAAEAAKAEAETKAAKLEAKVTAFSKGVSAEAVDDVIALAMSKIDDKTDIGKAIDSVIAKYPAFCGAGTQKPITTGISMGGGQPAVSGVEAAFYAKNPDIKRQ